MAVLPILTFPDSRLRRLCLPVTGIDDSLRALAADMLETMYAAQGRGLAGPQVGVLLRMFVMDVGWKEGAPSPQVCINPEVLDASEDVVTRTEGCLSIPDVACPVARPAEITLRWTTLDGVVLQERLSGFAATCAQHELDHLNGRLCIDLLDEPVRFAASSVLAAMRNPA
ncbi:peptide deformylase [Gemmobacter megaterium]|uniref:Peptide deformylase n=1 Tax=Gemmobacter megaterium TaxID=1086013 RepID=A0A1N7Q2N3_9RHOB|nr:peptide deformylase [Gemmobacter megaterium]GGE22487.1 peptide deformylase [Gemmobacter megaterium]SIT17110.1 peptide deformylase [Gemmobacter megaterium]